LPNFPNETKSKANFGSILKIIKVLKGLQVIFRMFHHFKIAILWVAKFENPLRVFQAELRDDGGRKVKINTEFCDVIYGRTPNFVYFPDALMKDMSTRRDWLKKQSKLKADESKRRGQKVCRFHTTMFQKARPFFRNMR
jgi:hypothetical protein